MYFKQPLGTLGVKPVAGERTISGLLQSALAAFPGDRAGAIAAIQRLQSIDRLAVAHAAVQLLLSAEKISPGLQHVASLPGAGNLLAELLMNQQALSLEAAVTLARKVAGFDPRLDVRLVRKVIANGEHGVGSITDTVALRMLQLVDAISDCTLLGSCLIQFLRHPSEKVRSKAALMLGRSNWNPDRVEALLSSDDARLRANAIESLWGHRQADVRKILWQATEDPSGRVVVNALLGLYLAGDREATARLAQLADAFDSGLRASAAWAMGESGDPFFAEALDKLTEDSDARVSAMAVKSRMRLREPEAVKSIESPLPAESETTDDVCQNQVSETEVSQNQVRWIPGERS
jgi:HEAT repeat protein